MLLGCSPWLDSTCLLIHKYALLSSPRWLSCPIERSCWCSSAVFAQPWPLHHWHLFLRVLLLLALPRRWRLHLQSWHRPYDYQNSICRRLDSGSWSWTLNLHFVWLRYLDEAHPSMLRLGSLQKLSFLLCQPHIHQIYLLLAILGLGVQSAPWHPQSSKDAYHQLSFKPRTALVDEKLGLQC